MDQAIAEKCWRGTEIIRKYQSALPTFLDVELPYVFVAEHPTVKDRVSTIMGYVVVNSPQISIPFYLADEGPQFRDGFEDICLAGPISFLRMIGFPYSFIDNKIQCDHILENGSLQGILKRHENELEAGNDIKTALIKGVYRGAQISLVRYLLQLAIESHPTNTREVLARLGKKGTPIGENDTITQAEMNKLFNPNL